MKTEKREYQKGEKLFRAAFIDTPQSENDEMQMCCSSEEPVERAFGTEVLDHSPECVDLSRMNSHAPLLVNHNPDDQVGVVTKAWVENKKMRASVKFSKSARGQEIRQDVLDGIRRSVSIGYVINSGSIEKRDGSEIYRVDSFTPLEVSVVAIPADYKQAGFGRAATGPDGGNKPKQEKPIMETQTHTGSAAATVEVKNDGLKLEQKRTAEIVAIGSEYAMRNEALDAIAKGMSVEDFKTQVMRAKFNAKPVSENDAKIGMSDKETRQFSIAKAITDISSGRGLEGLEREASAAAQKQYGRNTGPLGFTVPHDVAIARRDLVAGTGNVGGYTVATQLQSLVELLRNKMVALKAGVQVLGGLQGNISFPTQSGAGTAYWLAETGNITESTQGLGQINSTPHRLGAYTEFSKQLLAQSSIDVEGFVRNDLATVLALAIDKAILEGSGSSNQPTGVLNWSGKSTDVTFGAAPTFAKVVSFETNINTANADIGGMAFITTPAVVGAWKTTAKIGSTYPVYLIENGMANGYPVLSTNQVSSDKVLFGNWQSALLAQWGGTDVLVDPYGSQAIAGLIRIVTQTYVDVVVRQPKAFCVSSDAGNQ